MIPNFQVTFLNSTLAAGEDLAKQALTAEYLILYLTHDSLKHRYQDYVGRGQYPKFRHRHITKSNPLPSVYAKPEFLFWSELIQLAKLFTKRQVSAALTVKRESLLSNILYNIHPST